MDQNPQPRRRWFRFSLWTMLVGVAATVAWFAMVAFGATLVEATVVVAFLTLVAAIHRPDFDEWRRIKSRH